MLSTGWYRFSGAAGNQMAESCVDRYRCGTYHPGWLNGSHPTVNEAAVQRRVCFGFHGYCCIYSTYIRVRNCGDFYVYQLKPLTVWYSRYCGNGYVSSTPTTPGTRFPSFFFFFFSSWKERIRHLSMKQLTDTLFTFIWWKWTPFFLAYCHPYSPQINPLMRELIKQSLTTTVWLKYWCSVLKSLSEPKMFNLHP